MAEFSQLFTGKNVATVLPGNENVLRSQENLNNLVTKAEEIRYATYKENRDEFLKNAKIDPIFVLSDSARRTQLRLITDFNKTWGKVAQQRNYNLSEEDLLNMQTHKNLVIATQQEQMAEYKLWEEQRDAVDKDKGMNFDATKFIEATDKYMQGDKWNYNLNSFLKPLDFGLFANEEAQKLKFNFDRQEVPIGNNMVATESYNIPQGKTGQFLTGLLGQNPRADIDFFNKWNDADKEYYFKKAQETGRNAIELWAEDKYGGVRQSQQTGKRALPSQGEDKVPTSGVGGSPIKLNPGKQTPNMPKIYGDQKYSQTQSFSFGNNPTISGIPTRGGKAINANWTEDDIAKGSINGRLVLYDPIKKVFLVESVVASESADQKSRTLLEIPEENIIDYGNIPIEYIGNKMTIADYKKFMESPAPATPTGNPKSKGTLY